LILYFELPVFFKKTLYAKGFLKKAKENGVFVGAVASTGAMDRDGEILEPTGWDLTNFRKAPRILWGHEAHSLPIGKALDIKTSEKGLLFDFELAEKENDFAKKVADLMRGGFLNTFSVGFMAKEKDGDTFKKMELLEISVVNVPANADAMLSHEYKSFQKEEKKLFEKNNKDIIHQKPVDEDEKRIRIQINTCDVTATIQISEKQGISALYCGKEKKIRTYIFLKSKGWTIPKAKKWVEEHAGKSFKVYLIENEIRVLSEKDKIAVRNAIATLKGVLVSAKTKGSKKKAKVGSRRADNSNQNTILQALRIADRAIEGAIHNTKQKNA